jgi:hypothetical protein
LKKLMKLKMQKKMKNNNYIEKSLGVYALKLFFVDRLNFLFVAASKR